MSDGTSHRFTEEAAELDNGHEEAPADTNRWDLPSAGRVVGALPAQPEDLHPGEGDRDDVLFAPALVGLSGLWCSFPSTVERFALGPSRASR